MATKRPDVPEGQRTGLSMGPLLAQRMRTAGFSVARVAIHPVQTVEIEKVSKYVERLEHRLVRMARAASLNTSSPEVRAAVDALEALRASLPADHVGMGAHLVPTFVVAGVKT